MTLEEQLQKIEAIWARLERAATHAEKMWEKLDRLAALASAHADRQLLVLNRIEKNTDSNNRVSDQLAFHRQKVTELTEQREFIRAGLDSLITVIETKFAVVKNDLDEVDKNLDHIRDQSGKFPLTTPEEIRMEADQRAESLRLKAAAEAEAIRAEGEAAAQAVTRDPWYSRVLIVVFKGSPTAQITAVLLMLIAAAALILGGAQTIKTLWPSWGAPAVPAAPAAKPAAEGAAKGAEPHAEP